MVYTLTYRGCYILYTVKKSHVTLKCLKKWVWPKYNFVFCFIFTSNMSKKSPKVEIPQEIPNLNHDLNDATFKGFK